MAPSGSKHKNYQSWHSLTRRSMENTNEEDIKLLCSYRKRMLSKVEEQSQALDFVVMEDLIHSLLAQGVAAADIAQGRTRLARLICCHVEIERFKQDGTISPKGMSKGSNEQSRRTFSRSPAEPDSRMDVRPTSHTMYTDPQGSIPFYHTLRIQQPNTAKRRRVSGNEGVQPPTVCPTLMPEDNGSTNQAEGQHFSTDMSILPEQQHNSAPPFEEAGNIEQGRVSPTSHVATHGDLVPISKEMEVSQWPPKQ
jgi:hypothetical protein